MYVIQNTCHPGHYWSNDIGWCDFESATYFTPREQRFLNLPLEGAWCPLWSVDYIQFARLIAEAEAAGAFANPDVWDAIRESMDLTGDQLASIIERSQLCWEASKEKALDPDST